MITRQETELMLPLPAAVADAGPNRWEISYSIPEPPPTGLSATIPKKGVVSESGQLSLFN